MNEIGSHVSTGPSPGAVLLVVALIPVVAGVIMGLRGKIVVFRDFNDLALCFALPTVPLAMLYFGVRVGVTDSNNLPFWMSVAAAAALGLFGVLAARTFADNGSVLKTLLALVTKLPLGILFVLALLNMVAPSGRTARNRAGARQMAFAALFLLTPLLIGLTRDRASLGRLRIPHLR